MTKLTGSAEFLWRALTQQSVCTVKSLEDRVFETFDVNDPADVAMSVLEWAQNLARIGLLRVEDTASPDDTPERIAGASSKQPRSLPIDITLGQNEWVLMVHALVQGLAADLGARALSIKGPVLEHYGLRRFRPSSDAGVWLDEAHRSAVVAELIAQGWEERRDRGEHQARIMPAHSVTYFHPNWPIDLDLHWFFPGLGVDADTAFSRIWQQRSEMQAAGITINIPSIVDSALIEMLHCAKQITYSDRMSELEGVVRVVRSWPISRRQARVDRVIEQRASDPLQELFRINGIGSLPTQWNSEERKQWKFAAATGQGGSTAAILYQVWTSPWRKKPRDLWDGIWPSEKELVDTDMQHDSSKHHIRVIRYQRFLKGMRALPEAVVALSKLVTRTAAGQVRTQTKDDTKQQALNGVSLRNEYRNAVEFSGESGAVKFSRILGEDLGGQGLRLAALALLTVRGQATMLFRLSQRFGSRVPALGNMLKQWNHVLTGCDISWRAHVGPGLKLYHPTGVVIGPWVVMGCNCELQQGVTIGGAGFGIKRGESDPSPLIGDKVKFGSGAKAFGNITIGDDVILGANCVLVHNAVAGAVVTGVPGRSHGHKTPKKSGAK